MSPNVADAPGTGPPRPRSAWPSVATAPLLRLRRRRVETALLLCVASLLAAACLLSPPHSPPPSSVSGGGRAPSPHRRHGRLSLPVDTKVSDLFLSVKTTHRFHSSRLRPILATWFAQAGRSAWFFTDRDDPDVDAASDGHLVVTDCPESHSRQALCCKMAAEFDAFLSSGKRWFCHFDDDNYVNVPALVKKLREFDHRRDWYLGKPSTTEPVRLVDRASEAQVAFWFATGGAGFCLSSSLAAKMAPRVSQGGLVGVCNRLRLPDDVAMGFVAKHLAGAELTVVHEFHSHLEAQRNVADSPVQMQDQISFSYSKWRRTQSDEDGESFDNVLEVDGLWSGADDPTRFYSLHCLLFPAEDWCLAQGDQRKGNVQK